MHSTVSRNVAIFNQRFPLAKLGTYSQCWYMETFILKLIEWSTGLCRSLVNIMKMIQVKQAQIAVFRKRPRNPLLAYLRPCIQYWYMQALILKPIKCSTGLQCCKTNFVHTHKLKFSIKSVRHNNQCLCQQTSEKEGSTYT